MRHLGCPRSPVQRQLVVGRLELCGHVLTHKPMRAVKMCTKERQKRRAEHRRNGGRPEDVADGYVTTLRFVWVGWFVVFFYFEGAKLDIDTGGDSGQVSSDAWAEVAVIFQVSHCWLRYKNALFVFSRWGASLSVATCKGQRWRGQAAEVPQEGSEGGKPRAHERSEKVLRGAMKGVKLRADERSEKALCGHPFGTGCPFEVPRGMAAAASVSGTGRRRRGTWRLGERPSPERERKRTKEQHRRGAEHRKEVLQVRTAAGSICGPSS
ncbi:hypothetical protein GRJ2_002482800 [Grus japonensis]|uniref:Uncharacterized protein n=1 Tax=Grus japonensis TaxID=30415 RepID=A0ABC9XR28_GRUJA